MLPAASTNHRDRLLDAAQGLALAKGFPAMRIDEVCADAGVTKGSFYHHFESKDALGAALVDHYFGGMSAALCGGAWAAVEDPTRRVFAFLDHTIKAARRHLLKDGCLLGSFALDLSQTHPEIRQLVEARFRDLTNVLEPTFKAALTQHGRPAGLKAGDLARQFVAVLQGGIVLAKGCDDPKLLARGLTCFRDMLRAVLPA